MELDERDVWERTGLERLWFTVQTGVLPAPPGWNGRSRGIALGPGVLAMGWATVDLERTVGELPSASFTPAPDEESLGARALIAHGAAAELVLLEPSTEGLLAAFLARHGEGQAVMYLVAPDVADIAQVDQPRPSALGRPGWLMRAPDRYGPFVIVLQRT